jgi:hypothetical protein
MLTIPAILDFPVNHGVIYHREQRDKRVASRVSQSTSAGRSKAVCWSIQPQGILPFAMPESDIYRFDIPSRGTDDEPHFKIIPKYLMSASN